MRSCRRVGRSFCTRCPNTRRPRVRATLGKNAAVGASPFTSFPLPAARTELDPSRNAHTPRSKSGVLFHPCQRLAGCTSNAKVQESENRQIVFNCGRNPAANHCGCADNSPALHHSSPAPRARGTLLHGTSAQKGVMAQGKRNDGKVSHALWTESLTKSRSRFQFPFFPPIEKECNNYVTSTFENTARRYSRASPQGEAVIRTY